MKPLWKKIQKIRFGNYVINLIISNHKLIIFLNKIKLSDKKSKNWENKLKSIKLNFRILTGLCKNSKEKIWKINSFCQKQQNSNKECLRLLAKNLNKCWKIVLKFLQFCCIVNPKFYQSHWKPKKSRSSILTKI